MSGQIPARTMIALAAMSVWATVSPAAPILWPASEESSDDANFVNGTVGASSGDESPGPPPDANRFQRAFQERPDDPPGQPPPRASRSPARVWTRGMFSSVQVNVDSFGQNIVGDAANEPSIAIDATDRNRMAIGWRQFDTVESNFRQAGWGYTQDGGQTWTFPGVLEPGVFRSDPVLGSDSNGNLYYLSLKIVGSGHSATYNCDMYISADGGQSWNGPNFAFGGDKAWFAIDNLGGISDGQIYQAWNVAGNEYYPNTFNRSFDGGLTWSNPGWIPNEPVFGTVAFGPGGEVYVAGVRNSSWLLPFYVAKSSSAANPSQPVAFEQVVQVDMGGGLGFQDAPNPAGGMGQAWIAIDHSGGPNDGNIYLLASVQPRPLGTDPLDIHFTRSTDGGLTWSSPVRVNDDPVGNGAWQWFGTMSVAPNGRIDAIWNDTRSDFGLSELYHSFSRDGGLTWSKNVPVSPAFFSYLGWPNQNKIGDYYDMVSDDLGADVAYAATFNGEQDVYYLRIPQDCNSNGVPDDCDVDCGPTGGLCDIPGCGQSADCNTNGLPDDCELQLALTITAPLGLPVSMPPLRTKRFFVQITEQCEGLVLGSPALHYRYDGGTFQTIPLSTQDAPYYRVTLPAATCTDQPEFYFTAMGDAGSIVALPPDAPSTVFSLQISPQFPLSVTLPNGAPSSIVPGAPTTFRVNISEHCEVPVPGSAMLHYRYGGGSFESTPLIAIDESLHEATLPTPDCADQPEFYISAVGDGGSTMTLPPDAPLSFFTASVNPQVPLAMALPDEAPTSIPAARPTSFAVEITERCEKLATGSALLHYRYQGGSFLTVPLTTEGETLYVATLPSPACPDQPEFFVSALGDAGGMVTLPPDAPASFFTAQVSPQVPLTIVLPNGFPPSMPPATATALSVNITQHCEALVPGSAMLHYRYTGESFQTVPLTDMGETFYEAMLPAAGCSDRPEYFFSVQGDGGSTITLPADAPSSFFTTPVGEPVDALTEDFSVGAGPFIYQDGLFRGTENPDAAAEGSFDSTGGESGGSLRVSLGPESTEMSGGWVADFEVSNGSTDILVDLSYRLIMSGFYESGEIAQALMSVDGSMIGVPPNDYLAQLRGDGNVPSTDMDTGWRNQQFLVSELSSGSHQLAVGGYNNASSFFNEFTDVFFDNITVSVIECTPVTQMDIRPGACPNAFDRDGPGSLPVALLGTAAFDVTQIDLTSITLSRADGGGGSVRPHTVFDDVATPFETDGCTCRQLGKDGLVDLSMKFRNDNVVATLELDSELPGALIELVVSGLLNDGQPFEAFDCIRLVLPGTGTTRLRVTAGADNRWIEADPPDLALEGGGFGTFERVYPTESVVTLVAPQTTVKGMAFDAWIVDGARRAQGMRTLQLTVANEVHEVKSLYKRSGPTSHQPRRRQTTGVHEGL